jgi:hypothetical protein
MSDKRKFPREIHDANIRQIYTNNALCHALFCHCHTTNIATQLLSILLLEHLSRNTALLPHCQTPRRRVGTTVAPRPFDHHTL